ncbi:Tripartite tricarboxylate transporter family receptor [compost metagenome]
MTVVPYKGAGDVKTAILGNQAPVGIMAPGDIFQYIPDGRVVALGFMTDKRWSVLPHVPTMLEQGYKVTQGEAFMGLWASQKTPVDERQKMELAVKKALQSASFRDRILQSNLAPDFASGDDMDKQVRALIKFWTPVVKESNFKP